MTASLRVYPQPVNTESVPAQKNFISKRGSVSAGTRGVTDTDRDRQAALLGGGYEKHPLACLTTPPSNNCKKIHPSSPCGGNPRYRSSPFSQKFTLQIGKYSEAQEENCKALGRTLAQVHVPAAP